MKRILRGVKRRFNILYDRLILFDLDLAAYQYQPGLRQDLVLRRADPDEFRAMAQNPAFEIDDYILQDSLGLMAQGDECWVAERQGQIGFYVFAQFKTRFLATGSEVPIAPDTVYLIRGVTVARMRGQRLAPSTVGQLALHFRDLGYKRLLTDISVHNKPSLRYAVHVGWRPVGSFLRFTLRGRSRALVSRRVKKIISGQMSSAVRVLA